MRGVFSDLGLDMAQLEAATPRAGMGGPFIPVKLAGRRRRRSNASSTKMHNISNKPELSALVQTDKLGGGSWVPARFLRTLMSTAPDLEPEQFDACPVLLAHPGVDRMTDIALSRRFFERLAAPKRMVVLDGASHMPTEHPGVNQLEAAVVAFLRAPPTLAVRH